MRVVACVSALRMLCAGNKERLFEKVLEQVAGEVDVWRTASRATGSA